MSNKVLVTGGTGFLGEHVVAELLRRGKLEVRVLARTKSHSLTDAGAKSVLGDVMQKDGLAEALKGCEEVYHLAGFVSRDPKDTQKMMRVHVDGTRNILEAAKEAGVRRIVVASSSGTIAVSKDPTFIADEDSPYAVDVVGNWPYYLSKIYQEKLTFDLAKRLSLDVVVVNPSILFGPGDRRGSSTGDIKKFLKHEIPVVPSGGINFVDARDAATATVEAMDRGTRNSRYLLGGPNWTMKEFFSKLGRVAKVRPPFLKLPDKATRVLASITERAFKAANLKSPVDKISVEMSQHYWYCDSSKAERDLNFTTRDPIETLDDTIRDIRHRLEWDSSLPVTP